MKKTPQPTWGGRFAAGPAEVVKQFTESVSFDWRLYKQDIAASIAHAKGLVKAGVLTKAEAAKIERGLRVIEREIEAGKFKWNAALEDVHMNIEAALVRKIDATGAKLHTARSRNDQVATDLRLWLKSEIQGTKSGNKSASCQGVMAAIRNLQKSLIYLAEKNIDVVVPGYTHMQRAQPVLFAHHLLAYVEMFGRDVQRLEDCLKRVNVCPLGSGALAGSTLKIDRAYVAKLLGFNELTQNSMDAVSDRDFVVEFQAVAALVAVHLSRLAEDLLLWSSSEFGFVTIADAYTTGSSLMPQKKNLDVAELTRGKAGRVVGNLVAALTMLKGLPLTYNRDLQEDKQMLFDTADTLRMTLTVMAATLAHMRVNRVKCAAAASDPLLLATDLVDFLVKRGLAFREAHHAVGALVSESEKNGVPLPDLAARKHGMAAARVFDVHRALAARTAIGAPSPRNVRTQLARWKRLLK
jgi:argininosuccinate lyase